VVADDPMVPLAAAVLRLDAREPERALAVECGEGDPALFLAREFPRARVRGIDSSAEAVARATSRVGLDPEGRIAFKQGSPRRLPFPDDHFDLIVQTAGRPAAAEAARVLRPGGRLLLVHAERPAARFGPFRRWTARRLARSGFESLQEGGAGGGSFLVLGLRGAVPRGPSD
jgi:S-adenosylmethionine-diacylgycerolhomoserine-N-methlytransferase